jgi:hypothetical protein
MVKVIYGTIYWIFVAQQQSTDIHVVHVDTLSRFLANQSYSILLHVERRNIKYVKQQSLTHMM